MLYDLEMQFDLKSLRTFTDFGHRSLGWNVFTSYQKLLGLVAMLTTSWVILPYVYFIAKTNVQKANITLKFQDSGIRTLWSFYCISDYADM